uniref:Uncharacterized protein n=1 Tax=Romanomermis culicivorax TaxID=13658 RepID=A0A915JAH6_ROMCU
MEIIFGKHKTFLKERNRFGVQIEPVFVHPGYIIRFGKNYLVPQQKENGLTMVIQEALWYVHVVINQWQE